jgi:hypothetical protein
MQSRATRVVWVEQHNDECNRSPFFASSLRIRETGAELLVDSDSQFIDPLAPA